MNQASDPATRWREALGSWAIPDSILAQAHEDPWALPVTLFEQRQPDTISPSHRHALESLLPGATVLDVGAGRCAMSLPLRPPAQRIVAVDSAAAMLDNSPADVTVLGSWPDVAPQAGHASVVVCGHILYNVPDLVPFVTALNDAAERRVVVEITRSHPRNRALERELWRHFWNLERPEVPCFEDAVAVMREAGIQPEVELWESPQRGGFESLEELVSWMRQTVCLSPGRDDEVRAIVVEHAAEVDGLWRLSPEPRALATLWWDVTR
ncbi:MAG TPA: SAM-dependent methyltransferase [Candidatus Dormibacteraeota bacterium]